MPEEMIDRTIYVKTMKMRVHILQLSSKEFKLTGTPAPKADPEKEEVVDDMTELEGIYTALGLMDTNNVGGALKRALRPLWRTVERPIRQGWTRTRTVNEWKD